MISSFNILVIIRNLFLGFKTVQDLIITSGSVLQSEPEFRTSFQIYSIRQLRIAESAHGFTLEQLYLVNSGIVFISETKIQVSCIIACLNLKCATIPNSRNRKYTITG